MHERAVVNKTGHEATATDRALTGIRGLDDVLYGGFPRFARDDIGRIRRGHRLATVLALSGQNPPPTVDNSRKIQALNS